MNRRSESQARRSVGKKKPYRSPVLTVHGDITALTRTKNGHRGDGSGKPRTRASGGHA